MRICDILRVLRASPCRFDLVRSGQEVPVRLRLTTGVSKYYPSIMNTTLKQTNYYVTPEQYEKLRRLSFERKMSMSQLIRYSLDKVYFDGGEQKE